MSLVSLSVETVIKHTPYRTDKKDPYGWGYEWAVKKEIHPEFLMKSEDTYMLVFGPDQEESMKLFEDNFKNNIIFKSDKSTNTNYPHSGNRNTLFIFESVP